MHYKNHDQFKDINKLMHPSRNLDHANETTTIKKGHDINFHFEH